MLVQKKDGRLEEFDSDKILDSIKKAALAVDGKDEDIRARAKQVIEIRDELIRNGFDKDEAEAEAEEMFEGYIEDGEYTEYDEDEASEVLDIVTDSIDSYVADKIKDVDDELNDYVIESSLISDFVKKALMITQHSKTAEEYILYSSSRDRVREMNTSLMKSFENLTFGKSKDVETKRENANIDGDSAMGTMLKYGSEGAKKFNLLYVVSPAASRAHTDGDIHIHDLDFLSLTETCITEDTILTIDRCIITAKKFNQDINSNNEVNKWIDLDNVTILSKGNNVKAKRFIQRELGDKKVLEFKLDGSLIYFSEACDSEEIKHSEYTNTLRVTSDHIIPVVRDNSIIEIKACEIKPGDKLFLDVDYDTFAEPINDILGGRVIFKDGDHISPDFNEDAYWDAIEKNDYDSYSKLYYGALVVVTDVTEIPYNGYVYDFETENHYFSANGVTVHNCCQIDLDKLFKDGFNTGHGFLREPGEIRSYAALACIAVQSNQNDQHGGQSIPSFDYYMAPGVAKSFVKNIYKIIDIKYSEATNGDGNYTQDGKLTNLGIKNELKNYIAEHKLIMNDAGYEFIHDTFKNYCLELTDDEVGSIIDKAYEITDNDTHQAMEAVIHNLNSMHSRAGAQVPFSSINFGTDTSTEGRMASFNLLRATDEGLGNGETPIFPVSIFKEKAGVSYNPGDPNYDLWEEACRVSAKRLFPNFSNLDVPFNLQYYKEGDKDTEVAYMGCVQGSEVITYKIDGKLYVEGIGRAFNRLSSLGIVDNGVSKYIDTHDKSVSIFDSKCGKFVGVKKFILNNNRNNWYRLSLSNGRNLVATEDHPLPIKGKGRTFVKDMNTGDLVPVTYKQYSENTVTPSFSTNVAWMLGLILCDASYAGNVMISLGPNEFDIVDKVRSTATELGFDISVKEQTRGEKGHYLDVNIKAGSQLKHFRSYLTKLFGGKTKVERQIPNEVFSWADNYKYAFLAGMMDADGYVNHHRDGRTGDTCRCVIGSINKELALQEVALAQSLGLAAVHYDNHYSAGSDKVRVLVEFGFSSKLYEHMVSEKKKELLDAMKSSHVTPVEYAKVTSIEKIELDECSYDVETESDMFDVSGILSHNCRTRVMANVYNPNYEKVTGRGNLSFTSINLPRLGIKASGNIDRFFIMLDDMLELVHKQLLERFEVQCRKHPRNYPFLMGQGIWIGSDKLGPDDDIREILKNGTLTVGFIGLAECLKALMGVHHGESEDAQKLGLRIVGYMRKKTDEWSATEHMNYSVIGTPAEGLSGRFVKMDKKRFGIIPGVTDREYYTNSSHIPVYYPISAAKKIDLEAPYHALCNGGHISYIEMDGDPTKNLDAFKKIVRYMHDKGIGYGAVNHPIDRDSVCGYNGIIDDVCPRCGRREFEPMTPEMWNKLKWMNLFQILQAVGIAETLMKSLTE